MHPLHSKLKLELAIPQISAYFQLLASKQLGRQTLVYVLPKRVPGRQTLIRTQVLTQDEESKLAEHES